LHDLLLIWFTGRAVTLHIRDTTTTIDYRLSSPLTIKPNQTAAAAEAVPYHVANKQATIQPTGDSTIIKPFCLYYVKWNGLDRVKSNAS